MSRLAIAANPSASRPQPEPRPDELMAGLILFRYWREESEQVQSEGLDRLAREDREGAFARLNALWMALPVVTLQLDYVVLASHAEDAGGATAGVVVLPVEMLESLRELVRLGAISAATLSTGLTLMAGKPEAVGAPVPAAPSGRTPAGNRSSAPDPRIDGAKGLEHSFHRHARQWFGRPVNMSPHLEQWKALLKRAASSSQVFDWTTSAEPTTAHLARVEGKWFVVQFYILQRRQPRWPARDRDHGLRDLERAGIGSRA